MEQNTWGYYKRTCRAASLLNNAWDWSSQSPDLNGIKNLWCCLKKKTVNKQYGTKLKDLKLMCQEESLCKDGRKLTTTDLMLFAAKYGLTKYYLQGDEYLCRQNFSFYLFIIF